MENKDNNVIAFPGSKRTESAPKVQRPQSSQKKMALSLFGVMGLALALNSFSNNGPARSYEEEFKGSRSLASVAEITRDPKVERKLASKLKNAVKRDLASIGRRPSAEDKLRFEQLEGKYLIRFKKGKVKEIRFTGAQNAGAEPKYVNDRQGFIEANRNLMPFEYNNLISEKTEDKGSEVLETYSLVDDENQPLGKIKFTLDKSGRMLAMTIN